MILHNVQLRKQPVPHGGRVVTVWWIIPIRRDGRGYARMR
jgi:hypothetical protein